MPLAQRHGGRAITTGDRPAVKAEKTRRRTARASEAGPPRFCRAWEEFPSWLWKSP